MLVLDALMKALRSAGDYNHEAQAAPACILWPDGERQWEKTVARLQGDMPELFVLGSFDEAHRTGPAIWLRCVVARAVTEGNIAGDALPILYLPGVSRQDLRAVESCSDALKPIVELQYSGVLWLQESSKDWTVLAFLKTERGGLGLDVMQDIATKNAMQQAIVRLLDEDMDALRGRRLDADYFLSIMAGGDPVKNVLLWLDQGDTFKAGRTDAEWRAFVAVTDSRTGLNPERDGILTAAAKLATHDSEPWKAVWQRFCEAPGNYHNIPDRIRQATMPIADLFATVQSHGGWPQWNDAQDATLRTELVALENRTPGEACDTIAHLESVHASRRDLPWHQLGMTPLADALRHLAILADKTSVSLGAGSLQDVQDAYVGGAWQADNGVIESLACVKTPNDTEAVTAAIRAMYLPWADEAARHLQQLVQSGKYPVSTAERLPKPSYPDGECILFVDGLRFDLAKRLSSILQERSLRVAEQPWWVPLPSITATGKPAITPVQDLIVGGEESGDFEPIVAAGGKKLTAAILRKMMSDIGWSVLTEAETGTGHGHAWCENGNIDSLGHEHGAKMAIDVQRTLDELRDRVMDLLTAGWGSVRIVTDHGWLLMPGDLPFASLPAAVADNKWGRCASVKSGAIVSAQMYQWFWNPVFSFALPDGISCYRNGMAYAHGGISLQECLTLQLTVTTAPSEMSSALVYFVEVAWRGMRCTVTVKGMFSGLMVDIRKRPGEVKSSLASEKKAIREDGTASVLVGDENLEGVEAFIVLLDMNGELIAQRPTTVGGGKA
jgi:hypothetical protein